MYGFRLLWERLRDGHRKHGIFGFDREADMNSAKIAYRSLSREAPSKREAARLALALHFAYGGLVGVGYAAASESMPWLHGGSGALAGIILWLFADELPISLTGISNPFRKSAASHAAALAAHIVFAVTADKILLLTGENRRYSK